MLNFIVKLSIISCLFFSFSFSLAEQCLQGSLKLLTEEGLTPARPGIPISIKVNNIGRDKIGSTSTDRSGRFCISHNKPGAGREVLFEIGDPGSENKQVWSSWVVLSPHNGVSYFPSDDYQPLEIIITPAYMYSTFFKPAQKINEKEVCEVRKGMQFVQVASPRSLEEATNIENSLKTEYRTCITPVTIKKKKHYRVFAFPSKNVSAKKACQDIKRDYKYKCFSRP